MCVFLTLAKQVNNVYSLLNVTLKHCEEKYSKHQYSKEQCSVFNPSVAGQLQRFPHAGVILHSSLACFLVTERRRQGLSGENDRECFDR